MSLIYEEEDEATHGVQNAHHSPDTGLGDMMSVFFQLAGLVAQLRYGLVNCEESEWKEIQPLLDMLVDDVHALPREPRQRRQVGFRKKR